MRRWLLASPLVVIWAMSWLGLVATLAGGCSRAPGLADRPPPDQPIAIESTHQAVELVTNLEVEVDPNGYWIDICIEDLGCTSNGQRRTFTLVPGHRRIYAGDPGYGTLGTFAISDDNAILTTDHFAADGPGRIRARTAEVKIACPTYPCRIGFDGTGHGFGDNQTARLIVGRTYPIADYNSQGLDPAFGPYRFGDGPLLALDGSGDVSLGAASAWFTWDAASRTLRPRTTDLTIDLAGYVSHFYLGGHEFTAGVNRLPLIRGRRYRIHDYGSRDPQGGGFSFSAVPDVLLELAPDGSDSLRLIDGAATHFDSVPSTRHMKARVGTINAVATGYFLTTGYAGCMQNGGDGKLWPYPMLLGRRYPLQSLNTFFDYSQGGVCTPTNFTLPEGKSLHLDCGATPPPDRPADLVATTLSAREIRLDWEARAASAFVVQRSSDNFASAPTERPVTGSSTFVDIGLEPDTTYYYRVVAVDGAARSLPTSSVRASTGLECVDVPENAPCGNPCRPGICTGGRCLATGPGVVCPASHPCQPSTCDPLTGQCRTGHAVAGTPCDDGNACTVTSACNGFGGCEGGEPLTCPGDGHRCVVRYCERTQGCVSYTQPGCDEGLCAPNVDFDPNPGSPGGNQTPVGAEDPHPYACEVLFPIVVDTDDLRSGTFSLESAGGFFSQLNVGRPTFRLRQGVTYTLRAEQGRIVGSFTVGSNGRLQLTEDIHFKGNGSTVLVVVDTTLATPRLSWAMEERLGRGDDVRVRPASTYDPADPWNSLYPASWTIILDGCATKSPQPIVRYRWTLARPPLHIDPGTPVDPGGPGAGPEPGSLPPRIEDATNCRTEVSLAELGRYQLTLTVRNVLGEEFSTAPETIEPRDILVVSLGDSYASGEGNPIVHEGRPPTWDDPARRLSRWSGPTQAAVMLERSDPHTAVTYLSLAHSGSTIHEGILRPKAPHPEHWTDGTAVGAVPPQLDELKRLLQDGATRKSAHAGPTGVRPIDYLLLSIGGNDIGFSEIVVQCALPAGIDCYLYPFLTNRVFGGLRTLRDESYPELKRRITNELDVREVLQAEYADPTSENLYGAPCKMVFHRAIDPPGPLAHAATAAVFGVPFDFGDIDGEINRDEARWISTRLLPELNAAIESNRDPGTEPGHVRWTPVQGIAAEYRRAHGYCAMHNYIATYSESLGLLGDERGTMHPNRAGQEVVARHLARAMGVTKRFFVTEPAMVRANIGIPIPAECPGSQAGQSVVVGAQCKGDRCSTVGLSCKPPLDEHIAVGKQTWGNETSSGSPGRFTPPVGPELEGSGCGPRGVMTGLRCIYGNECATVRPKCGELEKGKLSRCAWSEKIWGARSTSEKPAGPDNEAGSWTVFLPGKVANAVQCFDEGCEAMRYYVCDLGPDDVR
jgi:hypothetical protein